jgi:hypothetical protein
MTSIKNLSNFFIGGLLVIGLLPLIRDAISYVNPVLGEAETLVISIIPLMIVGKWVFTLFEDRRVLNDG